MRSFHALLRSLLLASSIGAAVVSTRLFGAPSNGATCLPIPVTFSWTPTQYAVGYGLCISTKAGFSGTGEYSVGLSGEANTTTTVSSFLLPGTTYYWHIETMIQPPGATGQTYWSSTWSFTTANTMTLSSPSNGSTDQASSLILSWNANTCASTYYLQLSTKSNFSSLTSYYPSLTSLSQIQNRLTSGTTYYWRVGILDTSLWSPVWSFTTSYSAPETPVLTSPSNGSTGQPVSPTLSWGSVSGVSGYGLQVSTASGFSSIVLDQELSSTSLAPGLSSVTKYFWRVRGKNPAGTSPWCAAWSFTTLFPAPGLSSPANGSVNQPVALTLAWDTVLGTTSYGLQVATASDFGTTILSAGSPTSTVYKVSGLSNNTMYYWRANAASPLATSAWSAAWSFRTIVAVPAAPQLVSPSNSRLGLPLSIMFSWNSAPGTDSYTLQFSTQSSFAAPLQTTASTNQLSVSGFSLWTIYFWRVNATNFAGTSDWSSAWSFGTISSATLPDVSRLRGTSVAMRAGSLSYTLAQAGLVKITVCSLAGRVVFSSNLTQEAGKHSVSFRKSIAPGSYLLYFRAGGIERGTLFSVLP